MAAVNTTFIDLEARARRGDQEAQIALGREFVARRDARQARAWFATAAKSGHRDGLRLLAINLLTQSPIVESDAVNMMRAAADKGDAEAMYICALLAAQDTRLADRWHVARQILERSAAAGFELARSELAYIEESPSDDDVDCWTAPRNGSKLLITAVSESPRIEKIENFADPLACDWLIERARSRIGPAEVYDPGTGKGKLEKVRSNKAAMFNIVESNLVLLAIREQVTRIVNLPLASLEPSSVLHYDVGEQFEPHFDFLDADVPTYAREIASSGQRVATFLLYLNDDYEDGDTDFPDISLSFKGRKGDALLFWSVAPTGAPDLRTRHAGRPPTRGEKWVLSQWLRHRPSPIR